MRRILIDKAVEERAKEFAEAMKGNKPDLLKWNEGDTPMERLMAFREELEPQAGNERYVEYVDAIIGMYDDLLTLTPDKFSDTYEEHFKTWDDILKDKVVYGKEKKFYEHVIDCMGYADIRSNLMRQYMRVQRIKTCVYCNAQYAVTTEEFKEDGRTKRIGTYQLDHNWPESKYPFLCTTFYNLLPCCPTCNQTKLQNTAVFNLYTQKPEELDVFRFELTPDKALDAYVSDDMERLEVKLKCDSCEEMLKNHQKLFHIDLIYAEHKDVVQRIIVILQANSSYYRQSLQDGVRELFPNGVEDPGYFFFGYYMKKEYVHLQPLSKLVQDVVEEIERCGWR